MKKLLMYNQKIEKVIATQADVNRNIYRGYIEKGFIPIGYIDGWNVSIIQLNTENND
jgi:hypothetical protein